MELPLMQKTANCEKKRVFGDLLSLHSVILFMFNPMSAKVRPLIIKIRIVVLKDGSIMLKT